MTSPPALPSPWPHVVTVSDPAHGTEVEQFLIWLTIERGRSPRTVASYSADLRSYEESLEERGISLAQATPADVDRHLDRLRARGLSGATIARARSSVRGLHRFMFDEGLAAHDPAARAAEAPIPRRLPKALNQDDVIELLDGVNGDDALSRRDRAILELLYGTGARVSEITSLDLDDLAFDDGLLRVLGKGDKERLVPIGRAAQASLSRWLEPPGRPSVIASTSRGDARALFLNQRGGRISRQGVDLLVSTRAARAGIPGRVSPHVLRHSCATHMLERGADVRVVQELLGHASVATTQLYTKVTTEHLRHAYEEAHPRARRS